MVESVAIRYFTRGHTINIASKDHLLITLYEYCKNPLLIVPINLFITIIQYFNIHFFISLKRLKDMSFANVHFHKVRVWCTR